MPEEDVSCLGSREPSIRILALLPESENLAVQFDFTLRLDRSPLRCAMLIRTGRPATQLVRLRYMRYST